MTFADDWKKAGEPADDYDPDDGTYTVRITDGGAFTGNDGRQWAKLELQIQDGEHQGQKFVDFMNLNNDVGLRIARDNLALYGLAVAEIDELEDLDTAMLELVGTVADVSVKHSSGGFLNVTVRSARTGESDVPADQEQFDVGDTQPVRTGGGPHSEPDDDDPIPFRWDGPKEWDARYR